MNKENLKLTSPEIGTLWGEYVFGTMMDVVIKYMYSIIEDQKIKGLFKRAIDTFAHQKQQIIDFITKDGFPVPVGFDESDLYEGAKRLFTDPFCLQYLYVMTIHGLFGHTTSLTVSTRKDLREFYQSCDTEGMNLYQSTNDLLLELGRYERAPLFYPADHPEFIQSEAYTNGYFGDKRPLSATEIMSLSFNNKKTILAKALMIGFSQVTKLKEVREFLKLAEHVADKNIKAFGEIMAKDYLPTPLSWESEVTTSIDSPFSDKLMMYHAGFLFQNAQIYHGTGLASAMRKDLVLTYEKVIMKNQLLTKKWFDLMIKNKWLEQPPLAPNRNKIRNV